MVRTVADGMAPIEADGGTLTWERAGRSRVDFGCSGYCYPLSAGPDSLWCGSGFPISCLADAVSSWRFPCRSPASASDGQASQVSTSEIGGSRMGLQQTESGPAD